MKIISIKHNDIPYNKKIVLGKSSIHGVGIIARRQIKKGETVFVVKGTVKKWQVRDKKSALHGERWIGFGKNLWIDPVGWGRFINHSSNPNCGIMGKVLVKAMRPIVKGQEITMDYATTEEQLLWHLKDSNGQLVRSIQFLSQEKFRKYLPYVPYYFQKVYFNHHKIKNRG